MKNFLFCLLLLAPFSGPAQPDRAFSRAELQEDLRVLYSNLKRYQPGLYRFTPEREWERILRYAGEQIHDGMTDLEFFRVLSRVVASTREGHACVGSPADKETNIYRVLEDKSSLFFPFNLSFLHRRAYIRHNLSNNNNIQPGDEILSINGESMASIVTTLFLHINADGFIESSKFARLTKNFWQYYFWYVDQSPAFEIRYRSYARGTEHTARVDALPHPQVTRNYHLRYPGAGSPGKETDFSDLSFCQGEQTAVLTLRSFDTDIIRGGVDPEEFYGSVFRKLEAKKTGRLIIDLRGNNGGNAEFRNHLLAHLMAKPRRGLLYTSQSASGGMKKHYIPDPAKPVFRGKVYVLVDGSTYSSAAILAMFLRELAGAVIIGEEGGGRYDGVVALPAKEIRLPNSRISVSIPTATREFAVASPQAEPGRGIQPDYEVIPSVREMIAGKDCQMNFVLNLISKQNASTSSR